MPAELHARSCFSFLRAASTPEEMLRRAAELGLTHIALTDRDGVYGSARAHHEAKKLGIHAIVGAELTMEDGGVLPVLVRTRLGYQNLCRLITRSKLNAPKGKAVVTWDELSAFTEGLVCITGDADSALQVALAKSKEEASALAQRLVHLFGPANVHVTIQRHRMRGERRTESLLCDLAALHKLTVVASNSACYATMQRRELFDAVTCLHHHTHLDAAGTLLASNSQRYLKGPQEMRALFADKPEAIRHADRLADSLEFGLEDLGYKFPDYPVPPGHDMASLLREVTYLGAKQRYGALLRKEVTAQLEHELKLISKLGFCGYFLIVWDLMKWAKDTRGILCQGRGSAANSVVCYSLGITNADPVGSGLLFERFLSEGRNTWPDIDIDFPSGEHRESVIQEVFRRYAPYGAAMTANVITYRGRSAMREMGKVLNLPEDILNRFSDQYASGDFPHTLEVQDQLQRAGLQGTHPRLPTLIKLYQSIYGLPRHLGQHSGGMIICDTGLDSVVPLEPATMPGRTVVQWDKDDCHDLGIIKVDLLGLGMLAAMEETLAICTQRGRSVDLATLPKDDAATYELMQRADTVGTFQIESRAQMATLPRMKPHCFYDVVIEVAIIRPGPIVGKLVHPYLNRRSGREPIDYIDPRFEPVLARTLGVPLFQEQVLRMAMVIADFTGSEAEELRRAMSFHRSDERMAAVMAKLRAAMASKEVPQETQDRIVQSIQSFALYGFPESHAISFAIIAYASCWLKVHRTVEFYAGLLNHQPMGFYSRATLLKDAKRHGIRVRPVCVVASHTRCTVEDDHTLRLGFNQVKGFHATAAQALVDERTTGEWLSLEDLLNRTRLNKEDRRVLAKIGAFAALSTHRREALWQVEKEREDSLWSRIANSAEAAPLAAMSPFERLEADYTGQGLTTGPHPMAYVRNQLPGVVSAQEVQQQNHGQFIMVAGKVICRQRPGTAKGNMFISLEDETGIANVFVSSKLFETNRLTITQEPFLRIHGRVQNVESVVSVMALIIEALPFEIALNHQSHDFH